GGSRPASTLNYRPSGARYWEGCPISQGLAPLAIDRRPSGAEKQPSWRAFETTPRRGTERRGHPMDCPGPEQRQAFLRGDVGEEVAAHIEGCEACQAALGSLPDTVDQFQGQLRQAAREEAFTDDECRRALAPLEGLEGIPTEVPAAEPSPKPAWAPI